MSAHWKGPVTTAASTTLVHLFVPAKEGTHSMASPTVEVSGLALYGEPEPGSRATVEACLPRLGQRVHSWEWQQEKNPLKGIC